MKLNLNGRTIANINENQTVIVGEGIGEIYRFALHDGVVYFCAQQEGELFVRYYVCDETDCGIKFPCYD